MFATDSVSTESNSMEIYITIKGMGASFLKLEEIFRRILVILIPSATPEMSFSTIRRIKTYNRSTMARKRLHNLDLLSIEREKNEVSITNPEKICM